MLFSAVSAEAITGKDPVSRLPEDENNGRLRVQLGEFPNRRFMVDVIRSRFEFELLRSAMREQFSVGFEPMLVNIELFIVLVDPVHEEIRLLLPRTTNGRMNAQPIE